jgi:hypothetical protein
VSDLFGHVAPATEPPDGDAGREERGAFYTPELLALAMCRSLAGLIPAPEYVFEPGCGGRGARRRQLRRRRRRLARHRVGARALPDIAVNHDPEAVAMHAANHPSTKHFCEDVWKVDPKVPAAGAVALAWFSPDCKHFSKAKGGKPVDKKIRGLAWVVTRWAKAVRPRVIILENVEEFQDWGPLLDDGKPVPAAARPDVPALARRAAELRLRGRGARAARLRLRRADDAQAPLRHRAVGRPADRLAGADARAGRVPYRPRPSASSGCCRARRSSSGSGRWPRTRCAGSRAACGGT